MSRITKNRAFLYFLLFFLVGLSIIERIKIAGSFLEQTWWLLILFPLLHLSLHLIYLLKIHYIKNKHLGIILFSHMGYFLFFIFQHDIHEGQIKIILPEIVKSYNHSVSTSLYHFILPNSLPIGIFNLSVLVIAEVVLAFRINQYIKTEAVVI